VSAALLLTAALAAVPDACAGTEAAVRSATEAVTRGQWADAERLLQPVLAAHPDCPAALVLHGRLLARRGEPLAAREALERAAALDPGGAEARYQLGVWSFRAQRFPEAARYFEKAAALQPKDARAHDYLALTLEALGEPERAEAAYRSGLAHNHRPFFDPLLDYNYGRFLLKQHRLEESGAHLDRAVALLPGRRGPYYERGKLNLARGRHAEARADAERALALPDPAGLVLDLQVHYLLATVYARLGETELARKHAELARTTPIPAQAGDRR
jgi:tetratricopeptide (TPR) repeat protein